MLTAFILNNHEFKYTSDLLIIVSIFSFVLCIRIISPLNIKSYVTGIKVRDNYPKTMLIIIEYITT